MHKNGYAKTNRKKKQVHANYTHPIPIKAHAHAASIMMLTPTHAKPCFDTDPEVTEDAGLAVVPAGGNTTASIVCTTPLLQGRSAELTVAAPNFTANVTAPTSQPSQVMVTLPPCTVAGDCVALRSAAMIFPLMTWYFKMSARSLRANSAALSIFKATSAAAKAVSVGANKVKGPVPLKVSTRPAAMTASTRILKAGVA